MDKEIKNYFVKFIKVIIIILVMGLFYIRFWGSDKFSSTQGYTLMGLMGLLIIFGTIFFLLKRKDDDFKKNLKEIDPFENRFWITGYMVRYPIAFFIFALIWFIIAFIEFQKNRMDIAIVFLAFSIMLIFFGIWARKRKQRLSKK